jgi:MoxR-like ATPase
MADPAALAMKIIQNVEKVIVGKRPTVVLAVVAAFAEGHILLEDVPGVAKTMLARALAVSTGTVFKRIQCTPDLLPSDITGTSIFNQKTNEFEFRPGPLFAQIVLADEINRATPRTQAALLEAMGESRITADGVTHELKPPFLVLATQNPIDHEGTFPLPEAQLDRFLVRLSIGYPSVEEEAKMLQRQQEKHPIDEIEAIATPTDLVAAQKAARKVFVEDKVRSYLLELVRRTRDHEEVRLGGSPRASIALFRTSQALAALRGRSYVLPDDIKRLAVAVLAHRMILKPEARLRKRTAANIVDEILTELPAPVPQVKDEVVSLQG